MGAEGFQWAIGKPFGRLRRGETLCETEKSKGALFPCLPQGISFLWEVSSACGRTRYFPSLESTQRVPGAAQGCMSHGRPRTPVAKEQCTASLAGARPAEFTSVPGRATVAFGAADPSPGSTAPDYPWSVGKRPPRQDHFAATCAPAPGPCKVRTRPGTRLVAGPRPNQM